MQLKYSFKKEWSQFFRTFRLGGVILTLLSFALSNPFMFKFTSIIMNEFAGNLDEQTAAVSLSQSAPSDDLDSLLGGMGLSEMADMYNDAGKMFSTTVISFAAYGLLITMLILMSAAGGEQKKRAMIVPMCSGLDYKNYLIPKFVLYPATVFAVTFVSSLIAGGLCNVLFPVNHVPGEIVLLCSLMMSVFMSFVICVFLSLGLCTSRPGIMAPVVFVGEMFLESLLNGFGLTRYQPFALVSCINTATAKDGGFSLVEEGASIIVSVVICIVISVLMYFLALGVLQAKKIDNQEENKPEF